MKLKNFFKLKSAVLNIIKESKEDNFFDDFDDMVDDPFDFNNPKYEEKINSAAARFDSLVQGKDKEVFILDGSHGMKTPNMFVNYHLNLGNTLNPDSTTYYKDFNIILNDINKRMKHGSVKQINYDMYVFPNFK